MQDDTPGTDPDKRDGPDLKDEYLGAPRDGNASFFGKLLIAVLLLIVILIVFLVAGRSRHASTPPPPIAPVAAPVAERVQAAEPEVEQQAEPDEEPVDSLETARDKICRSIASEFVDAPSPTQEQMRRTLTMYNLNECSNRYIRDKDAEGRGLDKAELEAIQEQESVGPLRLEDK